MKSFEASKCCDEMPGSALANYQLKVKVYCVQDMRTYCGGINLLVINKMVSQGGSGVVSVKNHWQVLIIY
jgi:hypothetical protein